MQFKNINSAARDKARLEKALITEKDFNERKKIIYAIGKIMAYLTFAVKDKEYIDEIEIFERELKLKKIKRKINTIEKQDNQSEDLFDLYKKLGFYSSWIKFATQRNEAMNTW